MSEDNKDKTDCSETLNKELNTLHDQKPTTLTGFIWGIKTPYEMLFKKVFKHTAGKEYMDIAVYIQKNGICLPLSHLPSLDKEMTNKKNTKQGKLMHEMVTFHYWNRTWIRPQEWIDRHPIVKTVRFQCVNYNFYEDSKDSQDDINRTTNSNTQITSLYKRWDDALYGHIDQDQLMTTMYNREDCLWPTIETEKEPNGRRSKPLGPVYYRLTYADLQRITS